ncbi:MAG: AAA family ATPase [Desulfobacteraceae bacterium]|nr:AAA family ATPase [Desulfobacteraceae bacterium]
MPITSIMVKNFKGATFEQPLGKLNLFIGPNGAGKSARSGAILLTRLGFVPGSSKANPEIYSAYAGNAKDQMSVGFTANGLSFERIFIKKRGGAVSQKFTIGGSHNQTKEDFASYLKTKAPSIFDLENFFSLSDQKKIDLIFAMFPPSGDPVKLTNEIEDKSEEVKRKQKTSTELEGIVSRLTKSRTELKLPAGNLASVKEEISKIEEALANARAELTKVVKDRIESEAKLKAEAAIQPAIDSLEATRQQAESSLKAKTDRAGLIPMASTAISSITRILETLKGAGCDTCAAVMTAKAEFKKHKSQEMRF